MSQINKIEITKTLYEAADVMLKAQRVIAQTIKEIRDIEIKEEWEDITDYCRVELCPSMGHPGSRYIRILYTDCRIKANDEVVGIVSATDDKINTRKGFKVEKSEGAKFSFNISKRVN